MHEQREAVLWEDEIGRTGQIAPVHPEAVSQRVR